MSPTREIYEELARIQREGGAAALATVIGTLGSTPGKSMMKMLIRRDGRFFGSVGGGCVEAEVIERGRDVIVTERAQRFSVDLNENENPETGLVCGGRIEIFIEPVVMPNVFLFGAGHVGRAVCAHGVPVGFRFIVVDDRDGFASEERFPAAAERIARPWSDAIRQLDLTEDDIVLVMTRGHKDDLVVLRELATRAVHPRYLGLIGSKSKLKTLRRHLSADGVAATFVGRIVCPIGLPIGAQSADEIAISVLAELIRLRREPAPPAASS